MAAPKIIHGARAKVAIVDPATGSARVIGIFNSISYSVQYGAQAAYILGRYSPAELIYTHSEPIQMTLTGWRQVGQGPYATSGLPGGSPSGIVPKLQDLLTHEYVQISVIDRQLQAQGKDATIALIKQIRPTGYSISVANRQMSEVQMTAMGILIDDESTANDEAAFATSLP